MSDDEPQCGSVRNQTDLLGLRIASVFVIGVCAVFGTFFPILAKRTKWLKVPPLGYDFAKYFGSGVIIATAFIHLLDPALEALGSECLTGTWTEYPWALAIAMTSVFGIFLLELIAFRWGASKLAKIGISVPDPHGHDVGELKHGAGGNGSDAEHGGAQASVTENSEKHTAVTKPPGKPKGILDNGLTQIAGIAILEFGIVLHSVLIGLTLAVDPDFKVLFIVLVFHQTFEGLGLGTRLAFMPLAPGYNWVIHVGGIIYALSTPVGIAAGLGVRSTYNPDSTRATIVSGVLDSMSAGILLYTGLVELLAHEFLFNPDIHYMSNTRLTFALVSLLAGAGIMALLGRWA